MTFAIFFILFIGLFVAGLNILPTAGALPTAISDSVTLILGYMKSWDFFFPVHELLICVGIVLAFELSIWTTHVIFWVIKIIRGGTS